MTAAADCAMTAQAEGRRWARAVRLSTALHEAGHAIIGAALGLPPRGAVAGADGGHVAFFEADRPDPPPLPPLPREAAAVAMLVLSAVALAGGLASMQRMRRRGPLPWTPAASFVSDSDDEWGSAAEAELEALGIPPWASGGAAVALAEACLEHHARDLARIARLLYRRGRLDGADLRAALASVARCPDCREALGRAALALCAAHPYPIPAAAPPAAATGAASRAEDIETC